MIFGKRAGANFYPIIYLFISAVRLAVYPVLNETFSVSIYKKPAAVLIDFSKRSNPREYLKLGYFMIHLGVASSFNNTHTWKSSIRRSIIHLTPEMVYLVPFFLHKSNKEKVKVKEDK